ncbi:fused MFS/spermidine synthase [Candidatus Nitrosacidococcus sp. I8]|uniref:fused MFS/spermidine synthase n=1 Tax=Candidatus Nitrosacidococcus sp. I8 TaxID=2942908 RepID=UPI002226833F|nr:fused MFS/spermidine synthase [Candidatus Nitrosacidococcus sp. I8]CAH9017707.1 Polyamine aminopropyltransferase [Candidatus Nitrosacidococcus sp. I8]
MPRSEKIRLYLTVFLVGIAVMIVELLGTRIVAPFYGASLYVWSALISVTMMALAGGYFIGGYWADRTKKPYLSLVIACAALCIFLIPWITRPVLLATDSFELQLGAFLSAFILFSPCLVFLGMVSPMTIRLSSFALEKVGASAGTIYGISTLGSVIGTLFLGFYLFPRIGSYQILIGLGAVLFILSGITAFYERKKSKVYIFFLSIIFITAVAIGVLGIINTNRNNSIYPGGHLFEILSTQESLYGWVRVIDEPEKDLRLLATDSSIIGAASIHNGQNRLAYQDIIPLLPLLANHSVEHALLIGQGAGHMATVLKSQYGITVDTLEINSAVAQAATDYFGFIPTGKVMIGDARYKIRHLKDTYDLIIHDCFTGGAEPEYLLTVETLIQLRSLLSEQGMLVLNFVAFAEEGKNPALASVAKTIDQVFPHQTVFISDPGKDFNDFIFLANSSPIYLNKKFLSLSQSIWLKQRLFTVDKTKGILLTDNFHPLAQLQTKKASYYRSTLIDWLGTDLLIR